MRVTMQKIAEFSGVSRGTVDRVLNKKPGVRPEVRERVQMIADELGYRPNIIGKALSYQKRALEIGVIIGSEGNGFFDETKRGVERAYEEFKDFGMSLKLFRINEINAEEQTNIINKFIDDKVAGIILRPISDERVKEAINRAVDNDIPVITFASDIKDTKRMCFVGQDHEKEGRISGALLGKLLNGQGKIAALVSNLNILSHQLRVKGFTNIINEKFSKIKILGTIEDDNKKELTFERTLTFLKSVEDIDGIYVTTGNSEQVAKALKILNKENVMIIASSYYPEIVDLLKNNLIDFGLDQDPYNIGYQSMKIIFDYFFYDVKPTQDHFVIESAIKIKENF